jgi:transcriptional regulator with XRE-family HTH domain
VPKKKLSHEDVVGILKDRQGVKSLRQFAEELGISAPYLSDIYHGNRSVGPVILEQIGLGKVTENETYYVRNA